MILAESTDGEALLLVERQGAEEGQVLDRTQRKLYPPQPVASLLIRGGWAPYLGVQDSEELLQGVTHVEAVQ